VKNFFEDERNRKNIKRIIFVVYESKDVQIYYNLLSIYFPYSEIQVNLQPRSKKKPIQSKKEKSSKRDCVIFLKI
jgi:hypothetical protein